MKKIKGFLPKLRRLLTRMFFVLLLLIVMLLGGCQKTKEPEDTTYTSSVSVRIKDITPPTISSTKDTFTVDIGTAFDLKNEITATDNMDDNVSYEVSGNLDISTVGQYILLIKATDLSGNSTSKNITVNVVKTLQQPQQMPSTPERIPSSPDTPSLPTPGIRIERDYLYADGFDMNSAVATCHADLNAANRTGSCTPITDSTGIYIGMHLVLP